MKRWTRKNRKKVCRLYQLEKKSLNEISDSENIPMSSVYYILKKKGVNLRDKKNALKISFSNGRLSWNKGLNKKNDNRVNSMYKQGKNILCPICNEKFYIRPCELKSKKTCSKKCSNIMSSIRMKSKQPKNINNIKVWNKKIKTGENKRCFICGIVGYYCQSKIKRNKSNKFFCSYKCHGKDMKQIIKKLSGKNHPMYGRKHTKETKKIIGEESRKAWSNMDINKIFESTHPNTSIKEITKMFEDDNTLKEIKGRTKVAIKTIKRILVEKGYSDKDIRKEASKRLSILRKKDFKNKEYSERMKKIRENNYKKWKEYPSTHPAWKGGIQFEPYDKTFNNKFKRAIRKRDNQVCMLCGIHREKLKQALHVHHIDYNKLLSVSQNCISLCVSCHMKTNGNRKHWTTFFQSILSEKYGYNYSNNCEVIIDLNNKQL